MINWIKEKIEDIKLWWKLRKIKKIIQEEDPFIYEDI